MESFLFHAILGWRPVAYTALFFVLLVEGDLALFTAGYLSHGGYLDLGDTAFVAIAGVLIGDLLWYALGASLGRFFPAANRWVERVTRPVAGRAASQPLGTLLITKFTYGFHRPFLLRAGALRMPLATFLRADLFASVLWMVVIGALGYVAAASFSHLQRYVRFAEVGLALGMLLFWALSIALTRLTRRELR